MPFSHAVFQQKIPNTDHGIFQINLVLQNDKYDGLTGKDTQPIVSSPADVPGHHFREGSVILSSADESYLIKPCHNTPSCQQ